MATQGKSCSYRYDALDRLVTRLSPEQGAMQRFYCADRLSNESDGSHHRTHIQGAGQLLAQQDELAKEVNNRLLAPDRLNSVLAVNSDQCVSIVYTPYGHRESTGLLPGLPGLPGFNGEHPDPLTGHYLLGNGYRAFNPVLMRFNSPDSLSPFAGGGLNPYTYCLGDPINRVDPTGYLSWQAGLGWGFGVLGIMASIATLGAATPLAIAGMVTGLASGAAGVAQAVTAKTNPEASSVLGWVGLGLGVASFGFGVAAGFKKVGDQMYQRLVTSGGLSGKNGGGVNIGARMAKGLPAPVPKLEGMPMEIMDLVTKEMSGKDLANLSMTSSRMNRVINGLSATRFNGIMAKTRSYGGVIRNADNVGLGKIAGIAPAQAKRAGFTLKIAQADYPEPMIRVLPNGKVLRYGGVVFL